MAITVTADDVRAVLGPYARSWSDDQIMGQMVMLPARQQMLSWCGSIDEIIDPEAMEWASAALANIVAAQLILASPRFTASQIGESSVQFSSNSETVRADQLLARAKAMLGDVCPVAALPALPVFFTTARGRRGQ